MAIKQNKKPPVKSKGPEFVELPKDAKIAIMVTTPSMQAAAALLPWAKGPFGESETADTLVTQIRAANGLMVKGDMSGVECMLYDQAYALQMMFTSLSRRAANQEHLAQFQTHLTLALKAQSQCRATLQTLAEMKNPRPVAFVKQANIANGPQQVNNGIEPGQAASPARAEKMASQSNELSKVAHELLPNARTSCETIGTSPELEAVGAFNGSKKQSGKSR